MPLNREDRFCWITIALATVYFFGQIVRAAIR